MPTVYLDSHGSELALKVTRKTCSELLKYIANYSAVWFRWNSTCTALTFTKSVLFSLAVSFLLSLFVLFSEVPSLFHLGSRIGMQWLPGFRYVCVSACDRLCFCWTQTNLLLIPSLSQPHFHPSPFYSHDTINQFPFVRQCICYSVLCFLRVKKKAWSSLVSIHIKRKNTVHWMSTFVARNLRKRSRKISGIRRIKAMSGHVFQFVLRGWFLRVRNTRNRAGIIWRERRAAEAPCIHLNRQVVFDL